MEKVLYTIFNNRKFFVRQDRQDLDLNVYHEVITGDAYLMSVIQSVYMPTVVVDVGAHIGTFSMLAKKIWPNSKLIAVEPEPDNFELLSANLSGYPDVHVVHGAVAYKENKILYIGKTATGGNYMFDQNYGYNKELYYKADYEISLLKLKDIAPDVDCLKMDCEGGEYEIFECEDPNFLGGITMTLGEYHGGLVRFKTAIEKAMPQMQMFYTGPGNVAPTVQSRIGNFWGFDKRISIPTTVLQKLSRYIF